MKEWRRRHPKATLKEIEQALDGRSGRMRVLMLQDAAKASAAADIRSAAAEERPKCPQCGKELHSRGREVRKLTTQNNQVVRLSPRQKAHQVTAISESVLETAGLMAKTWSKSPCFCLQSDSFHWRLPFFRGVEIGTKLRGVPSVRRGLFPPWMRNWRYCLGH